MDLLSNNSTQTNKVSTLIFEALKEVGITPEEMSIAEKFFDFSSELDISLLDKIKCREFPHIDYGKCINTFSFIENQKNYLYFDRYVLFFDALMGNLAHRVMYRFSNFAYWYNRDNALHILINHAYAQRYDEVHSQAKLMAMFADMYSDNISKSEDIRQMAQSNPEVLYIAFKEYCISDNDANPQLVLAANALAYSSPNREGKYLNLKNKIERKAELSPEHAKEMADYIVDIFGKNVNHFQNLDIFQMIMSSMFTAIDFDDRIESKLLEKNYTEGVRWLRKAAEQGHAKAQFSLGITYQRGLGVEENSSEAVKWWLKAAELGDAKAQFYAGHAYEEGFGIGKDVAEAMRWYRKAAEQGHEGAREKVESGLGD